MNRRIVELETEAYNYVNSLLSPDDYPEDTYRWHHRVMFNKKFAELIVKECIAQASISNGHGNNQWDKALTFAADNIKKHFGVEE